MNDIAVGRFTIPDDEIEWSFSPSGGPGGQHANRSNTRAELRFDLVGSDVFPPSLKSEMMERLGGRVANGVVAVSVDESRSQFRNRAIARRRLAEVLSEAMRRATPRRQTKPTHTSRRRRLDEKRRRAEIKRLRRSPDDQ